MKKIHDLNRSIGSLGHKCFGALLCDECGKPSNNLYQFRLENEEPSETSYCSNCFDKIVKELKKECHINGDKTCECYHFCMLNNEQFDSILS